MNPLIDKHHYVAEIVESSLYTWTAQCWRWDHIPEFGSLVHVHNKKRTIYGLVHAITTGSLDSNRYPFTYQKTEEELMTEQPQIFEFLKTHITCITLGFEEHEKIIYQIPPEPPKIHAFVGPAQTQALKVFFAQPDFLHLLFQSPEITQIDELFLGLLRHLKKHNLLTEEKVTQYLEILTLLIGNDYRRLSILIQRIESLIT